MTLRVVKDDGRSREGGNCAQCGDGYDGRDGHRLFVEYGAPAIVEPMVVCESCYVELGGDL